MIQPSVFRVFRQEVARELTLNPPSAAGLFTGADIAGLPVPVQRCFRTCGWIGKPKMTNAAIAIKDMQLRMNLKADFARVRSYQFNSVARPVRLVYLKTRIAGIIPVCGRDRYQDGAGHMWIRMGFFPLADLRGEEMNRAALVTVLAETFIAPALALKPCIRWTPLNDYSASATLTDGSTSVQGTFYFNEVGEFVRFETMDRSLAQKDGSMKRSRWVATLGDYSERNGVRVAGRMSALWETPGGLREYARMTIGDVRYDVRTFEEVLF